MATIPFAATATATVTNLSSISSKPGFEITAMNKAAGTATVKLNDTYDLQFSEGGQSVEIINKKTGEKTKIHGDPHVTWQANGATNFNHFGTMTFKLDDGTKITVNTKPWNGNVNATFADNIVVTNNAGDSLIVNNLGDLVAGNLTVDIGKNGAALDRLVADGNLTVFEDPNGAGWLNKDGQIATQKDGDLTKFKAGEKFSQSQADLEAQFKAMFKGTTSGDMDKIGKAFGRQPGESWFMAIARFFGERLDKKQEELLEKIGELEEAETNSTGDDKAALTNKLEMEIKALFAEYERKSSNYYESVKSFNAALGSASRSVS